MASTMRGMARGVFNPEPDIIEQKQEKLVAPAQLESPLELVAVPDIAVTDLPSAVSESTAPEIVSSEPETVVENFENSEIAPPAEPVAEPVDETAQSKSPAEKKNKPKPPAKKPKAADQKKVITPKVETDV